MRQVIVSDFHLGSGFCRAHDILGFLERREFDELIVNGDLLDHLDLRSYKKKHWRILKILQDIQPTIILGNHDVAREGSDLFLRSIFKNVVMDKILTLSNGKKYLVSHGNAFDPLLNFTLLTDTADYAYNLSHRISKRLGRWLKKKVKKLGGVMDNIIDRAVDEAFNRGFQGCILGHTHHYEDSVIRGVHYMNSGCWTGTESPTYIDIEDGREPELCSYEEGLVRIAV